MSRSAILALSLVSTLALTGCERFAERRLAEQCQKPLDVPAASTLALAPNAVWPEAVPLYPGATQEPRNAGTRGSYRLVVQPFNTPDEPRKIINFYNDRLKAAGLTVCPSVVYSDRFGQVRVLRDGGEIAINVRRDSDVTMGTIEVYEAQGATNS